MLRTVGIKRNIENLFSLSQPYTQGGDYSFLGLKRAYKKFLHQIQPSVPVSFLDTIEFLKDVPRTREMISLFAEKSRLDDFDRVFSDDSQFQNEHLDLAEWYLQELKKVDEQLYSLFSLAINILFSGPSALASGGSSSGAIGCIWINPRPTWGLQDFLEFFVHEMTHNLVFLDEYRYHHYEGYAEMFLEENYAMSAILAKKRPLDKVFHSILVSTEVLLTRRDILGHPGSPILHPPTSIMLEKTFESIDYVERNSTVYSLLTSRGKELITTCKEHLKDVKASYTPTEALAAMSNLDHTTITSDLVY
jgi:hypothetical protein